MEEIDKPFRPGKDFLIAWGVIEIATILIAKPWSFALPWYSKVCFVLGIPFLLTLCIYGPILFIRQVITSGPRGRFVFAAFLRVVLVVALILVCYQFGVLGDRRIPPVAVLALAAGASLYLQKQLGKK